MQLNRTFLCWLLMTSLEYHQAETLAAWADLRNGKSSTMAEVRLKVNFNMGLPFHACSAVMPQRRHRASRVPLTHKRGHCGKQAMANYLRPPTPRGWRDPRRASFWTGRAAGSDSCAVAAVCSVPCMVQTLPSRTALWIMRMFRRRPTSRYTVHTSVFNA